MSCAPRVSLTARASEHPLSLNQRIQTWSEGEEARKRIDPINQPNYRASSNTLIPAIMANPRGDAVHKHAPRTLEGLD
jgi:hypothetical protein